MAIVPSRLGQAVLGTLPTLVYTVPTGKLSATIRSIVGNYESQQPSVKRIVRDKRGLITKIIEE